MVDSIWMLCCLLALFTGGALADVCLGNVYTSPFYAYSVYCDNGCCGSYYARECCGSIIGLIIGAVIGGLCFIGGIIFLICLCHHCNKRKASVGMVMRPNQQGGNVTVVNANSGQPGAYPYNQPGTQPGAYPYNQPGAQPGAYQQPGTYPPPGPNQAPMVAYTSPVVYGNPNVPPPAYLPPTAGQSDPSPFNQPLPEKH